MTLGQAIVSQSWDELALLSEHYFGVQVYPKDLMKVCKKHPLKPRDNSAIYPRLEDRREELLPWLKNRLGEIDAFRAGCNNNSPEIKTATFHIFFLFLDESQEMIDRLRNGKEEIESEVARSKISKTPNNPQPTDRVARRVTQFSSKDAK